MIETRAFDNHHHEPVVVVVATGTHDVSRLVQLFSTGTCEQVDVGQRIARQLRRHNAGRYALKLLRDHGGKDFTEEPPAWPPVMRAADVNQLYQDHGVGAVLVARELLGKLDWLMLNEGAASRTAQPFLTEWPNLLVVACPASEKLPTPAPGAQLSTPIPWT